MALHARDLVEFCHTLQTGSERELKKALRDTLMRAALYELLSTMANCGKIVTFLCLGIL